MTALDEARTHFEAGELGKAREAAGRGLADSPDDVELLRLAGRAGVEVGADDAAEQLRRVAELEPDSAEAWHDLGDALAADGRTDEAAEAFRRAVELNPQDEAALTHLGHTEFAAGRGEGLSHLEQVAGSTGGMSTAVISLVEMYKSVGQPEEALGAARKIAEAEPDDVAAALDVAELSLEVGRLDEALRGFERIRELEDLPDHEVYALHGMILVALRRGDDARALELATEAVRVDEYGRTADVLAHLVPPEAGDDGEAEPPPSRDQVEAALTESLREHRRLHAEDRRLLAEDLGG